MAITVRQMLSEKPVNAIFAVRPHHTVLEGLRVMEKRNIGAVLVMEEDRLVGIFSERDYARKGIIKGLKAKTTTISDVMTPKVVTVSPDENIRDCFTKMQTGHFRHLPVLENGQILGLLSIGDLMVARIEEQKNHITFLQRRIAG